MRAWIRRGLTLAALALAALSTTLATTTDARATSVTVDQATPEQLQSASDAFKRAKLAFHDGRLEAALADFRRAYDIVASPNAHLMVAVTLIEMGHHPGAYDVLRQVIAEAEQAAVAKPKYQRTADAARARQREIRPRIGLVKVLGAASTATTGATLWINGRELPSEQWSDPIAVTPGPVDVRLSGQPPRSDVVAAGGELTIDLTAATGSEAPPPHSGYDGPDRLLVAIIAGGVGVVGLSSAALFGGLAQSKFDKLEDECPNGQCPFEFQSEADSGSQFQAVSNVSLSIGLIGIAVGAGFFTWHLLDGGDLGGDDPESDPDPAPSGTDISFTFGLGSMLMQGTF